MANLAHKVLSTLTLTLLLAACSQQPAHYESPVAVTPPHNTPPIRFPGEQPITPRTDSYERVPSSHYDALMLTGSFANSPALRRFIQKMVRQYGFSEAYLNGLFSSAKRLDGVIRLESPAPSTGPSKPHLGSWTRYRNKFLTDAHISNGVEFWRNNAESIAQASRTYGVDAEYIVGIIGVETYFGKNFGKTCIFDALTTLSFATVRRSSYFMSELEHFLLMTRDEAFDPRQPQGSWAGAMGYGQFMPSSFRRLAVDFNKDGRRDLWQPTDAVGSVAHYFSRSGWQLHRPVAQPDRPANDPAVIELSTYQGSEYWRVYPNFKVIKKYNNSNKYAMAVHQLAQAIKQRYQREAGLGNR
ncbi:MAG: lytic murein transglycosylase [Methylococcaceae bacterium]|nr:lytic murein transglycosylase [Methylococcaceae bacterium]